MAIFTKEELEALKIIDAQIDFECNRNSSTYKPKRARHHGVGGIITRHRGELRLSQEKFAEMMGVSKTAVSAWERNRNTPNIEKIRAVFPELAQKIEEAASRDANTESG